MVSNLRSLVSSMVAILIWLILMLLANIVSNGYWLVVDLPL